MTQPEHRARRTFTTHTALGLLGIAALSGGFGFLGLSKALATKTPGFPVTKTDDEWRAQLGPDAYRILRHEATERPHTSALLNEKREGTYHCRGCDTALYASSTKYNSGTGWPSFYEALPGAVGTKTDRKLLLVRTEVHCATCGGHLGHIFDDGPPPTGKRHCINGLAMTFKPAA